MALGTKKSRRDFLRQAGISSVATLGAPYFVPAHVLGGQASTPPSDKLGVAVISTGVMGRGHLGWLFGQKDVQVRALCDVDQAELRKAFEIANSVESGKECVGFGDYREMLARPDIDVVFVVTPDHWHSKITVDAAKAGKDIYCQKPLANSIGEGRAMVDAVKQNDRIMQCGSQERSNPNVRYACELVRNGKLGEIKTIQVYLPCEEDHHNEARGRQGNLVPAEVPAGFDYDFWLGHTEEVPYADKRCHFWWRFNSRYGAGEMTDRGAHVIDIAQLALVMDHSGPVEYQAEGVPLKGDLYDAFMDFTFENVYPNGVRMIGHKTGPRGIKFEGTEGSLFVHIHGGKLEAEPASLLDIQFGDGDVQLGRTPDHQRNFIDCVRSREEPFAGGEIGHRTATLCQLNVIAMRLGRPLKWDPVTEKIIDDEEANEYLMPRMREKWSLDS